MTRTLSRPASLRTECHSFLWVSAGHVHGHLPHRYSIATRVPVRLPPGLAWGMIGRSAHVRRGEWQRATFRRPLLCRGATSRRLPTSARTMAVAAHVAHGITIPPGRPILPSFLCPLATISAINSFPGEETVGALVLLCVVDSSMGVLCRGIPTGHTITSSPGRPVVLVLCTRGGR